MGAFVGSRVLNCYSEAVLRGRGPDGAITAISHRHRRPLAMWMLAAGFGPQQLYVLAPGQLAVTAARTAPAHRRHLNAELASAGRRRPGCTDDGIA